MVTREELLAAAQRQLNLDPTASMAAIANAAGVGRATLHRQFDTREALLDEIGTRSLDRWQSRLVEHQAADVAASGDPDRIATCLQGLMDDYVTDSDDFGFALTDSYMCRSAEHRSRSEDLFEQEVVLYAAAQAAGVLRQDVPARWIAHSVYGLLVAAREALQAGDVARRDLGELVHSMLITGGGAR